MSSLFPLRTEVGPRPRDPRVLALDDEDADEVFAALSAGTARRVLLALSDEPKTASDLAEAVDSSIQNVRYHLDNLADAGLVEVVDTWYSSRGREMDVYAPTDSALIVTSDRSRADRLKRAVAGFLGAVGILGLLSLLVQFAAEQVLFDGTSSGDAGAPVAAAQDTEMATRTVAESASSAPTWPVPPGLLFFAGGFLVVCSVALVWYVRTR